MPRKARIDAPGAVHHIIIRGIEQKKIFRNDSDRANFTRRLGQVLSDTKTACFAWALIPNHAHILLRTGLLPISTVMARLLTGYAVSFNRKYRRHGQLFQNRYKSILCQEDAYLKELIRYIHLNPLRARLVPDMKVLDEFPWAGHSALMGKVPREWQDTEYVLSLFGKTVSSAHRGYRSFVERGIEDGKRPDLTGGGLIRSLGGWQNVKALRGSGIRYKGDERILGDSEFVESVLKRADEKMEMHHVLEAEGHNFDTVVAQVASILEIEPEDIFGPSKKPVSVKARSLLCYWANRELGMTTVELSRRLKISQSAVSRASARGEGIAAKESLRLVRRADQLGIA